MTASPQIDVVAPADITEGSGPDDRIAVAGTEKVRRKSDVSGDRRAG
ncbi:hypothetical protein [Mycobacterium sp. ST-F2]|nr:hypothetical protein [Mycobacterium sp. ST-F2]